MNPTNKLTMLFSVVLCFLMLGVAGILAQEQLEIDSDGDGIPDLYDACPREFGDAEFAGCPKPGSVGNDFDSDGYADDNDECPFVGGIFGGCPAGTVTPDAIEAIPFDSIDLAKFDNCVVTNLSDRVNIRSKPNTKSNILTVLAYNDTVNVVGTNITGDWYHVQTNGLLGWIYRPVVRESPACAFPTSTPTVESSIPAEILLELVATNDSLTLYVTDAAVLDLSDIGFRSVANRNIHSFELSDLTVAPIIALDAIVTPVCIHLQKSETDLLIPIDCPDQATIAQVFEESDVFWYNDNEVIEYQITLNGLPVADCKSNENPCIVLVDGLRLTSSSSQTEVPTPSATPYPTDTQPTYTPNPE